MRIVCLLLLGCMPMLTYCQHPLIDPRDYTGSSAYDSLAKYTYLVTGVQHVRRAHARRRDPSNSSAFFIRKNDSLYLVSAWHVFTGYDLFNKAFRFDRPDTLQVWFTDSAGKYTFIAIPVERLKQKPGRSAMTMADVYVMDVTDAFVHVAVFSVENLLPDEQDKNSKVKEGDSVIGFGYYKDSTGKIPPVRGGSPVAPSFDSIAIVIPMPSDLPHPMDTIYHTIRPAFRDGFSGAPVFRVRSYGKGKVDIIFAGVQSANKDDDSQSVIVQGYQVTRLLQSK